MASATPASPQSGVIVIVEDPFVRRFILKVLDRGGHTAVESDPGRAVGMLRSGGVKVRLLITNTPGLFQHLAENLSILYVSAFPDLAQTSGFREVRVLRKPFRAEELLHAVGEMAGSL